MIKASPIGLSRCHCFSEGIGVFYKSPANAISLLDRGCRSFRDRPVVRGL